MDDVDARRLGLFRRAPGDRRPRYSIVPAFGLTAPPMTRGQRRFARAIFAEKRVDLARRDGEVDPVEASSPRDRTSRCLSA